MLWMGTQHATRALRGRMGIFDHTIDRVVDIGLIVAIGVNSEFGVDLSLALGAALLTLMGSYMGTQAQSVGLGRIYGGFSRADRMVITVVGMLLASLQAADVFSHCDNPRCARCFRNAGS